MGLSLITDLKRAREYKVVAVTTVNMNVWTNVLVKVVLKFLYTKNPKQTNKNKNSDGDTSKKPTSLGYIHGERNVQ